MAEPTTDTRPVEETPIEETAVEETPIEETPKVDEPKVDETEVDETKVEESNVKEDEVETPADEPEEDIKSKKVTLADLSAKGTALYAHKKYEEATDIFSRASDLQAEINGETAPENAEILFHYGRSLFKVGQSKSDVLGGPAAAEKKTKANDGAPAKKSADTKAKKATQDAAGQSEKGADGEGKDIPEGKKQLFQFTGDENFDDSEEDEEQGGEEEQEEDDDDLATAFEILDLARVCYVKQLDKIQQEDEKEKENDKGKEVAEEDSSAVRHIKERLAETHDCLAEISLENERYPNAIEDGRTSLNYKLDLYSKDSDIIAEAHYKLSLALEFASVTISDDDGKNTKREEMDQSMRDEAVKEMELAIESFRLKMQATEAETASSAIPEDNELSHKALVEMKEIIADMEQRLVDLRKDPISAQDLIGGSEGNPLGGLFGAALGASTAEVEARVEEAKKTAVDLTGLVRKKKTKDTDVDGDAAKTTPPATNGKRKAEDEVSEDAESKKAKVEDEVEEN
ncbi:hypothetical protein PT974_11533 [Cladobotryum mycophilum]|uniref:Tetratricopeptide SHNi-TPR domain-containing protein n=1 Tax=Cladobotryum mycophilum TaxID=491253 RepID=A0ABR0S6E8_9HYPO